MNSCSLLNIQDKIQEKKDASLLILEKSGLLKILRSKFNFRLRLKQKKNNLDVNFTSNLIKFVLINLRNKGTEENMRL